MGNHSRRQMAVLLASVFMIATCGILYELLISTISTYFLGSSVLHFSVTIGLFMSAMGIGSYLSKYIENQLLERFIQIEIWLGLMGGLSAFLLFFAYSLTPHYHLVAGGLIVFLGTFIGLEIPLVTRIIQQYASLKDSIAQVLSFDYIGALVASLVFPLLLLPYLGTMRTGFLVGMLNLAVALFNLSVFKTQLLATYRRLMLVTMLLMAGLLAGFLYSFKITSFFEKFIYQDEVILAEQSPYQRIVMSKWKDDIRLFINGNLQFSSVDEYRYHEPLTHIPLAASRQRTHILLLGGGDGLAAKEILKWPDVQSITVIDLDPKMTDLGKNNPLFRQLNQNAFNNPKVKIINEDAFNFVSQTTDKYNCIIIDLPDPNDNGLGKLYTREFYEIVKKHLTPDGIVVTQATSPYFAKNAYWCIAHTMQAVFPSVVPYTTYVPSFGQWGFVMASFQEIDKQRIASKLFAQKIPLKHLSAASFGALFLFEPDAAEVATSLNTLDNQALVDYYEKATQKWEQP
ncbi:MAG: polyamine aminopropyltransferase [Spirosomaceae bacterium]|jgi:spermidine synthase|nr:polyamine aminopropyltransferase [Spirosomataceae bacterium]